VAAARCKGREGIATAAAVTVVVMAGMCEPKCKPDARLVLVLVEAADGFCQE
jgi:hypothetical protein